jgi:tetratricopeptide (TPR) repeat protein
MRRIIFTLFSFCSTICVPAQNNQADSLEILLKQHSQEDTIRLNLLINLSNKYAELDISKGMATADQAILLAKKVNAPQLGKAYFAKALNYMNNDEYSQALKTLDLAVPAFVAAKDSMGLARTYFGKGLAYFNISAHDTAIIQHQKALAIYKALGEEKRMANALNSIGANYRNLSNYPKAIDYYLEALAKYEATGSFSETAMALSNIGMIYKDIEDYNHALAYYEKALDTYRQLDDKRGLCKTLTNIGIAYDGLKNSDKALGYFQQALKISEELDWQIEICTNLAEIGIIYKNRKEYETALPYFNKALAIATTLGNKRSIGAINNHIGTVLLYCSKSLLEKEGIKPADRYSKALERQLTGLKLAEENGTLYEVSNSLGLISEVYEAKGDYRQSLAYHKQFTTLRDSIFSDKSTMKIARKGVQYEFEKKEALTKAENEKQKALADSAIKRQRIIKNSVMAGTVVLLLGAISSFVFYKRHRDAEILKTAAEFKAQVAETEMKALRAQMNPHFIFNSLNSISDYISKNDLKNADQYLSKFAKIMRMILENSEQKEIPLVDDLKALDLYLQLESARMNNKFSYEIKVSDDIDQENTLVPPLIMQPFVENSIWHGITKKQGQGKILINIFKEGNMLNCTVEDNGVGREASAADAQVTKKSLGMKITKARIDIINKLKRSNAGVNLTDLAEGTKVEVKLPLELSF